jgi:hypothetical protein
LINDSKIGKLFREHVRYLDIFSPPDVAEEKGDVLDGDLLPLAVMHI